MEFVVRYTADQERFREHVRAWLTENVPPETIGTDEHFESYDVYAAKRLLGRRLGERGWLYPMAPPKYGGGGLDLDSSMVIVEELTEYGLGLPPYYDSGGVLGSAAILEWATEEQKARLLPPIFRGEQRTWQLLTEPSAGSDLASVSTTATRDGDAYVIRGQKTFIGSLHGADAHWTILRTGRPEDRHHNLSWFMIDGDLPGISISPQYLIGNIQKNTVFFDDVRVPARNLVGGQDNGWQVATVHLDHEHGLRSDRMIGQKLDRVWQAAKELLSTGQVSTDLDRAADTLAEIYIRKEAVRLLGLRNYWLAMEGHDRSYEGSQAYYLEKKATQWMAQALIDAFGASALNDLTNSDLNRELVAQQALGVLSMHGGGTGEIQKLLISRHLGLGRQQLRP